MLAGRSRSCSVSSDSSTSSYSSSSSEDVPIHDVTRDTPPRDPLDIDAIVEYNLWNTPYRALPRKPKDGNSDHDFSKADVQFSEERSFPDYTQTTSTTANANPGHSCGCKIPPSPAITYKSGQCSSFRCSLELGTLESNHNVADTPRRTGRLTKRVAIRAEPYPAISLEAGMAKPKKGSGRKASSSSRQPKKRRMGAGGRTLK